MTSLGREQQCQKLANFENTFLLMHRSQRLDHCVTPAAAIDRIDHLVVHGNDVLLIAAAIDAEAKNVARLKSVPTKTYHVILLGLPLWFWICFFGAWCRVMVHISLIFCLNLKSKGPIKGFT